MSITGGEHYTGFVPAALQPSAALLSGLGFQGALEQFGTPSLLAVTAFQVVSGEEIIHLRVRLSNSRAQILSRMSRYRFKIRASQFQLSL